jgi:SAM-dependent methyltransferase
MPETGFTVSPRSVIEAEGLSIPSFLDRDGAANIDWETVESFGAEWEHFNAFSASEIEAMGDGYFDALPPGFLTPRTSVLEIGSGSGRWLRYLAPKVGRVEAIEPSSAVVVSARSAAPHPNVRVVQADLARCPYPEGAFDLVIALGVLHHMPDTARAVIDAARYVRPGGRLLVYLYYALDNRGRGFRALYAASNALRRGIVRLPERAKGAICDALAVTVYMPFVMAARAVAALAGPAAAERWVPLSYYRDRSFMVIRNDARDRFGTPLERRFSRGEVVAMLEAAGLEDVIVGEGQPYYHASARRPESGSG